MKRTAATALALVGGLAWSGCEQQLPFHPVANQLPSVTLTAAPIDTTLQYFYVARVHWQGFDPDGRVVYFEYTLVDSLVTPDRITRWSRIAKNDSTFFFRSTRPDSINPAGTRMVDLHTLFIRAVDNEGGRSPWAWRTFYSYTVAPSVRILSPPPSELLNLKVAPSIFIQWQGDDPDGEFTKKPLKYKFKLFSADDPSIDRNDPLSFNRFGPGFAGWDSVGGDTTFKLYSDLVPQQNYVFVVTGFDEAGAYDPVFSRNTNVLFFRATLAGLLGPRIVVFNGFIDYTYASGGYSTDDSRVIRVEVPSQTKVRWNWYAIPPEGALIKRTRWKLDDVVELTDETARTDEKTDLVHWSRWQSCGDVREDAVIVELPEFRGAACNDTTSESHTLYIEVDDNVGFRSLGIVAFTVVEPCFDQPLLIVDDRRGLPDESRGSPPIVNPPKGPWPTEAELDTFFFAVGNKPWKGYGPENGLPQQLYTVPGVFAGYPYDTVDTRWHIPDPIFPLSVLAHYRHVVWYIDATSANAPVQNGPLDLILPLTSLVWMNSPNRPNTPAIYSSRGGKLFFFGGGVVLGAMAGWRQPPGSVWSAYGSRADLIPGRFVYDYLMMQSEVTTLPANSVRVHPRRPGLFAGLSELRPKRNNDPIPPFRSSGFIPNQGQVEHVTSPLYVLEDQDPDPDRLDEVSVLDSLFAVYGPGIQKPGSPCGFYYRGARHGSVIFLGFDLWSWKRSQIITNVDVFLRDVWGLPRDPVQRESGLAAARHARE